MQTETQIRSIEEKINGLLAAHPAHFLVEVRIKPTNNIKVFIDGDEGVVLSDLIQYNRKLYKELEDSGFYPDGNFSLEVSSPGLDEPLKLFRQYKKNIGRYVDITMNDLSKRKENCSKPVKTAWWWKWKAARAGKRKYGRKRSHLNR